MRRSLAALAVASAALLFIGESNADYLVSTPTIAPPNAVLQPVKSGSVGPAVLNWFSQVDQSGVPLGVSPFGTSPGGVGASGTNSSIFFNNGSGQTPASITNPLPFAPAPAPFGYGLPAISDGPSISGKVLAAQSANFYGVYANSPVSVWLMVFNSATIPGNGATAPGGSGTSGALVHCVGPSSNPFISFGGDPPEPFSTGVSVALSSTPCGTLTLSASGFIHGRAF